MREQSLASDRKAYTSSHGLTFVRHKSTAEVVDGHMTVTQGKDEVAPEQIDLDDRGGKLDGVQ